LIIMSKYLSVWRFFCL